MNKQQIGNLVLRLVLGIIFLVHGIAKFQTGLDNTAGWFQSIGLPGALAYIVAIMEVACGLAVIVGLATRWVSAGLTIILLGAIFTVKLSAGFTGTAGKTGYEFDLALLAISVYLTLVGSEGLSMDRWLLRGKKSEGVKENPSS
ncbi:DoxX family protein [Thermoflavimicrobium daqui]|uniref:Oxidoreductase n=1 Tax=Thermoflavimicrobium daqui TaxID=2137476 RepID=A0A364K1B5_9BACL|nr:DoxX family protein [Thermoflavimicrobium daqui]RAL21405.1 oxidoreductase [Thermoflavimicrobium daqui]